MIVICGVVLTVVFLATTTKGKSILCAKCTTFRINPGIPSTHFSNSPPPIFTPQIGPQELDFLTDTNTNMSTVTTWKQFKPDIIGEAANDLFGCSMDLSADGRILAAGARWNDGNEQENTGHVRVFSYSTNETTTSKPSWTQLGQDIYGESAYDWPRYSVALSSDGTFPGPGRVLVFCFVLKGGFAQKGYCVDGTSLESIFYHF